MTNSRIVLANPTAIFFDNHLHEGTFWFFSTFYRELMQLYKTFSDEENPDFDRRHKMQILIKELHLLEQIAQDKDKIHLLPENKESYAKVMQSRKVNYYALQLLTQMQDAEYNPADRRADDAFALEAAGYGQAGFAGRDWPWAHQLLRDQTFAKLGLAHAQVLQHYLLHIGQLHFGLAKEDIAKLFVFVHIYSDKPSSRSNYLEARVRAGKVDYPFPIHCFEVTNAAQLRMAKDGIFSLIDKTAEQLRQSSLMNFRKEQAFKLDALTKDAHQELQNIITSHKNQIPYQPKNIPLVLQNPLTSSGQTRKFHSLSTAYRPRTIPHTLPAPLISPKQMQKFSLVNTPLRQASLFRQPLHLNLMTVPTALTIVNRLMRR